MIHKTPEKIPAQTRAAIKATWALFQQISADTKDLDDIPHYWLQAQRLRLPSIQYTAREVRSGLLFLAYAQRRSAAASAVFGARVQQHLDRYGICLRDLVWQTDNGSEFIGGPVARRLRNRRGVDRTSASIKCYQQSYLGNEVNRAAK